MENLYKNSRAYQCSILDYDNIMELYRKRPYIQGSPKILKNDQEFSSYVTEVLLGHKEGYYILASEDIISKKITSFIFLIFPKDSQFGFMKLGVTAPRDNALPNIENTGGMALFKLGVLLSKHRGVFDTFLNLKLSSYLPLSKLWNSSPDETGYQNITHLFLHKVLYPEDVPKTSIEKLLLGGSLFERIYPSVIVHISIKEEFRVEHYKHHFSVSEETLKRCTVPGYACSTSTITSLGTNS